MTWLWLLYDLILELKTLVIVWLLSVLLAAFVYRAFVRRGKDSLYWLLLPLALATFIITPLIYILARGQSLF